MNDKEKEEGVVKEITDQPIVDNENSPEGEEVVEKAKDEGLIVDEEAAPETKTDEVAEETASEEPSLISKYFPGVEITEENKDVLQSAAEKISRYEAVNREFAAIFNEYPEVGQALLDVRQGADFHQAYRRYVDVDSLKPLEDGEYKKGWDEARSMREKRLSEKEQMNASAEEARENSVKVLLAYKEKEGMSDEDFSKLVNFTLTTIDAIVTGGLKESDVVNMHRLMNYDTDMENKEAEALEVGRVQGKNEKIVKNKESEKDTEGSGLPDMSGGVNKTETKVPKASLNINKKEEFRV